MKNLAITVIFESHLRACPQASILCTHTFGLSSPQVWYPVHRQIFVPKLHSTLWNKWLAHSTIQWGGTMIFLVLSTMMFRVDKNSVKYGAICKHHTPGGVRGYKKMMPVDRPLLFTYYLHTVRAFTKLAALLQLTLLLRIRLLRYLGMSGLT